MIKSHTDLNFKKISELPFFLNQNNYDIYQSQWMSRTPLVDSELPATIAREFLEMQSEV